MLQTFSVAGVLRGEHRWPAQSKYSGVASTPQQRGEEGQGALVFCGRAYFREKAFGGLGCDRQRTCFPLGATVHAGD